MRSSTLILMPVFIGMTTVGALMTNVRSPECCSPSAEVSITMKPVGVVHKKEKTAWIEISPKYVKGLKGLEDYSHVWIIWWLDRNDTPRERSILQVHPKGNPRNPMTGVFATRSPVRPNLIAMSLCEIESIKKNKIEIGRIDAFDCTPVMDIKPYIPAVDKVEQVKLPAWLKGSG